MNPVDPASPTSTTSSVSIGTHSLSLTTHRPIHPPGRSSDPAIIFIPGLASPSSSFSTVIRLLHPQIPTLPIYTYTRSSFHPNKPSPLSPTATNIAHELDLLLQSAAIPGPYILVAHSWGGVLAREFLARKKEGEVVGIVFVEANQEKTLERADWRPIVKWIGESGVDILEISGLEREKKMSDEEWKVFLEDMRDMNVNMQAGAEQAQYAESFGVLGAKGQLNRDPPLLGRWPVSIIKGRNGRELRRLFETAVEKGYGSEEERERFGESLERFDEVDRELQEEVKSLSTNNRFVEAKGSGHMVQITEPEVIVEEVKWVAIQVLSKLDGKQ